MQILLHLYYISRGIFGHFCAFLGKKFAFRLFFIYFHRPLSILFIYFYFIFFFYFFFFLGGGGGGGWQLGGNLYNFKQILKFFMQLVVILHLYHG